MADVLAFESEWPDGGEAATILSEAAAELDDRGLLHAAQWAQDLSLCALDASAPAASSASAHGPDESQMAPQCSAADAAPIASTPARRFPASSRPRVRFDASASSRTLPPPLAAGDVSATQGAQHAARAFTEKTFRAARLSFSLAQLERCVFQLEDAIDDERCNFLRLYSQFLLSERSVLDAERILPRVPGHLPGASAGLLPLLHGLVKPSDPYLLYLKGVILFRLHKTPEAADCLIRSVRAFPYNWSAWLELSKCLGPDTFDLADVSDLLPHSFMTTFFIEMHARSRARDEEANVLRQNLLLQRFPGSSYLLTAKALTAHTQMRHAEACELFAELFEMDPFATEGLAEYSNSLHLLRDRTTLAGLANRLEPLAASNAQVCVLLGNYHNSRGDRVRAIAAFQRALRLDMGCVMAWVLLGHEYVELKNAPAASEMYRRALAVDPSDFRSWHGLGQVYELSEAWGYAVYYYSRAASVRPYDPRIWLALGACYDKLARPEEAVRAYERQLACHPDRTESLAAIDRIITLLERAGRDTDALPWHLRLVALVDSQLFHHRTDDEGDDEPLPGGLARYARSYLAAARHELGDGDTSAVTHVGAGGGNIALAHEYLQKVVLAGSQLSDEAEELLKRVRMG